MFSLPIATAAAVAGPTVVAVGAIAYAYRHPSVNEVDDYGRVRRRSSRLRSTPEELDRRRSLEYEEQHSMLTDEDRMHPQPITRDSSTMSRAKHGLEQTSEDIGSAVRTASDRISLAGQQTMDKARDMTQSVRDTAESAWDKTRETEASAMNKTRSWFDWVTGGGRRAEGSDEAREQRVADTASDIAASSRGARRELSDAASRTGSAIGDMANAASDTVQRTASESMNVTKSKSNQMKDDMDENYQEARERSRSIAGQAVDSVNDTFNATEERVSNVGHAMADHTQQAADTMDSMLRRTPEELQQARAGDQTAVESRELAREANNPERGGIHRTPRRAGMDPYNEPKWMRKTGVNFSHNSEHRWID